MTRAQHLWHVHNISETCSYRILENTGWGRWNTLYNIYILLFSIIIIIVIVIITIIIIFFFFFLLLLPVVPAWGGTEVALGLYYNTFLIFRTCMRRAPARPLRVRFFFFFFETVALLFKNMTCGARDPSAVQCTKYFPVLPCTTKLAQSTSQYYFVHSCNSHAAITIGFAAWRG